MIILLILSGIYFYITQKRSRKELLENNKKHKSIIKKRTNKKAFKNKPDELNPENNHPKEVDENRSEIDKLRADLNRVLSDNVRFSSEIEKIEKIEFVNNQLTSENKQIKSEYNEIQSKYNEIQSKYNEIQSKYNEIQLKYNEIQLENNEIQLENKQIKNDLNSLNLNLKYDNILGNIDVKQQLIYIQQKIIAINEKLNEIKINNIDNKMKIQITKILNAFLFLNNIRLLLYSRKYINSLLRAEIKKNKANLKKSKKKYLIDFVGLSLENEISKKNYISNFIVLVVGDDEESKNKYNIILDFLYFIKNYLNNNIHLVSPIEDLNYNKIFFQIFTKNEATENSEEIYSYSENEQNLQSNQNKIINNTSKNDNKDEENNKSVILNQNNSNKNIKNPENKNDKLDNPPKDENNNDNDSGNKNDKLDNLLKDENNNDNNSENKNDKLDNSPKDENNNDNNSENKNDKLNMHNIVKKENLIKQSIDFLKAKINESSINLINNQEIEETTKDNKKTDEIKIENFDIKTTNENDDINKANFNIQINNDKNNKISIENNIQKKENNNINFTIDKTSVELNEINEYNKILKSINSISCQSLINEIDDMINIKIETGNIYNNGVFYHYQKEIDNSIEKIKLFSIKELTQESLTNFHNQFINYFSTSIREKIPERYSQIFEDAKKEINKKYESILTKFNYYKKLFQFLIKIKNTYFEKNKSNQSIIFNDYIKTSIININSLISTLSKLEINLKQLKGKLEEHIEKYITYLILDFERKEIQKNISSIKDVLTFENLVEEWKLQYSEKHIEKIKKNYKIINNQANKYEINIGAKITEVEYLYSSQDYLKYINKKILKNMEAKEILDYIQNLAEKDDINNNDNYFLFGIDEEIDYSSIEILPD